MLRRLGILLALVIVARLGVGLYVDAQASRFVRRCERISVGAGYDDARAAIGAAPRQGEPSDGTHSFLFHEGWTGMACAVTVKSDRVSERHIQRWHDLDSCSDRAGYPHRFWLCRIGRALLP